MSDKIGFSNEGRSTLNGNHTALTTTITIQTADAATFPATGAFDFRIINEYIHVPASANTGGPVYVGVLRHQYGSVAAPYSNLTPVTEVVTATEMASLVQQRDFLLANAGDVLVTSPSNGEVLTYVGAASKWENVAGLGAVIAETIVSGSPVASITFSAIPQTYKHLELLISAASTGTNANKRVFLGIRFNGDSGANYDDGGLFQATYAVDAAATSACLGSMPCASNAVGVANSIHTRICDYTNASKQNNYRSESSYIFDATGAAVFAGGGRRSVAAAITSITLLDQNGGNLAVGTIATLIGVN